MASYTDMKVHIENKHPKEPFGVAQEEKYKKLFEEAKAATYAAQSAKKGQMSKKDGGAKKASGSKKGTGNTDALPSELLAAMAGMSRAGNKAPKKKGPPSAHDLQRAHLAKLKGKKA